MQRKKSAEVTQYNVTFSCFPRTVLFYCSDLEEKLSSIEMSREIMKAELLQKEADRSVVNQSQPRLDKLEDAISTLRAKIVSLE